MSIQKLSIFFPGGKTMPNTYSEMEIARNLWCDQRNTSFQSSSFQELSAAEQQLSEVAIEDPKEEHCSAFHAKLQLFAGFKTGCIHWVEPFLQHLVRSFGPPLLELILRADSHGLTGKSELKDLSLFAGSMWFMNYLIPLLKGIPNNRPKVGWFMTYFCLSMPNLLPMKLHQPKFARRRRCRLSSRTWNSA